MGKTYNGIPYNECQYETLPLEERLQCCELCNEIFGDEKCRYDATVLVGGKGNEGANL